MPGQTLNVSLESVDKETPPAKKRKKSKKCETNEQTSLLTGPSIKQENTVTEAVEGENGEKK